MIWRKIETSNQNGQRTTTSVIAIEFLYSYSIRTQLYFSNRLNKFRYFKVTSMVCKLRICSNFLRIFHNHLLNAFNWLILPFLLLYIYIHHNKENRDNVILFIKNKVFCTFFPKSNHNFRKIYNWALQIKLRMH